MKMQLGSFEVPDSRLIPNAISDVKILFDSVKHDTVSTKDVGGIFQYKSYTTGVFYRRLNSMISYGLLEQVGRGNFKVSSLGEGLAYPESQELESQLKTKAVLNVNLWNEIFKKHGKNPPSDSFWVLLKNITGIDPVQAKKIQSLILKWYNEDIANVVEGAMGSESQTQSLSSTGSQPNQMSQLIVQQPDVEVISFDKYKISLPKGDLKKEWAKLKKYMDVKLEDYEYEEPQLEPEPDTGNIDGEEIPENEPDN